MNYPYTITHESVSVVIRGETYTAKRGDENFEKLRKAVLVGDWEAIPKMISKGFVLEEWLKSAGHEGFEFKSGFIHYQGDRVDSGLNKRMISMAQAGDDPGFLLRFWENLQENPSYRSVRQLYPFLDNEGIPITNDGHFLAYKSVTRDYKDHHTKAVDNSIGQKPKMPRNKISDDPKVACHEGYHLGALSYAKSFRSGYRIVICKVHPRDVVCIPYDFSQRKMRVCTYEIIGNLGDKLPDTVMDTSEDEAVNTPIPEEIVVVGVPDPDYEDVAGGEGDLKDPCSALEDAAGGFADKLKAAPVFPAKKLDTWAAFDDLDSDQLKGQTMANLRKYASRVLKIVGASKLRKFQQNDEGKETGLIARILDVRSEK